MAQYHADKAAGFPNVDRNAYHPDHPNGSRVVDFNISNGLITGCNVCDQATNTSRCQGCKVVSYCGREHQTIDWSAHKSFCSKIKKMRARLEEQETALRVHQGDEDTPPNAFEKDGEDYGMFWMYMGLRPYMKTRQALVDALVQVNTKDAIEAAFAHCVEMMRLNTADNQGMGNMLPALLLRQGKDQQCYNTLRWHHVGQSEAGEPKNEDALEPVLDFLRPRVPLAHLVALALVKVRLLIDMRGIHLRHQATSSYEPQRYVSGITARHHERFAHASAEISDMLKLQVMNMYVGVWFSNELFWPALLSPDEDLRIRPNMGWKGSKQEMQISLQQTYNAWVESPGAIEVMREMADDVDLREQLRRVPRG